MMGKTHIAIGIASALTLMQPKTETELATAIIGGAVGGIMADIDVKINTSNEYAKKASMDALYGEISAIIIAISALAADILNGSNIIHRILTNWKFAIVGAIAFVILTVIGELSSHRDKTHSLLACALFSISVILIDTRMGIAFLFGYLSHLIIDLLNKKPERLFYPRKKGICFSTCYADRLGNELLFAFGAGVSVLMALLVFSRI